MVNIGQIIFVADNKKFIVTQTLIYVLIIFA